MKLFILFMHVHNIHFINTYCTFKLKWIHHSIIHFKISIDHKSIAKSPKAALILCLGWREVFVGIYKLNTQNALRICALKLNLIIKLNLLRYVTKCLYGHGPYDSSLKVASVKFQSVLLIGKCSLLLLYTCIINSSLKDNSEFDT